MKFSIIVPIYNREAYLRRCLDSVIKQTYSDWELILVDDGSSDFSPMICDEYKDKHPEKIHVFRQENSGVLAARRMGLRHVKGDYLCFLDSDDYWDPTFLEEMDSFQKTYDPDIVVFGYRKVGPQGELLGEESPAQEVRMYQPEEMRLVYEKVSQGKLSSLCTQVVKCSVVDFESDYSSFYKVFRGEDLLQNLSFIDRASKVLFVPNIYYSYFINVAGLSQRKISISYLDSHVIVQEIILDYMKKWGISTEQTYQMFVGVFNKTLKAFMQNAFIDPLYSKSEVHEILLFLSTGIRYEYLTKITIDWRQKRLALSLFLLKRRHFRMLKLTLFFCRILNVLKNILRRNMKRHERKEKNV